MRPGNPLASSSKHLAGSLAALSIAAGSLFVGSGVAAGSGPSCDKRSAAAVARSSGLLAASSRQWHGLQFRVNKVLCANLTGSGGNDMVVWLQTRGGTVSSPTPWAIFNPGRTWILRFTRVATIAFDLRVTGRSVIEKQPQYGPHDRLCCPSSYRYFRVRWIVGAYRLS